MVIIILFLMTIAIVTIPCRSWTGGLARRPWGAWRWVDPNGRAPQDHNHRGTEQKYCTTRSGALCERWVGYLQIGDLQVGWGCLGGQLLVQGSPAGEGDHPSCGECCIQFLFDHLSCCSPSLCSVCRAVKRARAPPCLNKGLETICQHPRAKRSIWERRGVQMLFIYMGARGQGGPCPDLLVILWPSKGRFARMREDYGRDYPPRINTTKKRTSSGFVSLKKIWKWKPREAAIATSFGA